MNRNRRVFLAGDAGATKIDPQLLVVEGTSVSMRPLGVTLLEDLKSRGFGFREYLDAVIRPALAAEGYEFSQLDGALFDAAGLVKGGVVSHEPYPNGRLEVANGCEAAGISRWGLLNDGEAQCMALYRPEVWDAATVLHAGRESILEQRDPRNMGFLGLGTGLAFTHNVAGKVIGAEGGNTRVGFIPNLQRWCPASAGIYDYLQTHFDDDGCKWETLVSISGLKVIAEFVTGRTLTREEVDRAVIDDARIAEVFAFWAGVRAGTMVIDGPGLSGVALRGAHNMAVFKDQQDYFLRGLRATGVRGRTMAEHRGYLWYEVPHDTWLGLIAWAERQWPELFA